MDSVGAVPLFCVAFEAFHGGRADMSRGGEKIGQVGMEMVTPTD